VWEAYQDGNIYNKNILDAGSGTGVLAYAALYLGCNFLTAVEIDIDQKEILESNLKEFQNKEIIIGNISEFQGRCDTVLCNPPFGAVKKNNDLPFLERIFEFGKYLYIIHNAVNDQFMTKFISERGELIRKNRIEMNLPRMYKHHTREQKNVELLAYVVRSY
jgi:putative methylase